jgi:hypothetical protein
MPVAPAAFRNDRREISGSAGQPHRSATGATSIVVVGRAERTMGRMDISIT